MELQLKPTDLRIGNIVYYQTEEGLVPNIIDWEDLKRCVEHPENFNNEYKGIPLNWPLRDSLGLVWEDFGDWAYWHGHIGEWGVFQLYNDGTGLFFQLNTTCSIKLEYFHQLQNAIYFSTGDEFFPNKELLFEKLDPEKLKCADLSDPNIGELPF